MNKAIAKAPANIAFIKYWGKKDEKFRIPTNSSISMNLSNVFTETSIEFVEGLKKDTIQINGKTVDANEEIRISKQLDRIRSISEVKLKAIVLSINNFPKGTGIASSASGFAALTVAGAKAANLSLSEKGLSILARLGSGSACRSIPDGFVEWKIGNTTDSSYAHSIHPPDYWEIYDIIAIVEEKRKKVSSSEGHSRAGSSPFFKERILGMSKKIGEVKKSLENKDFSRLGQIIEAEALNMHSVMMTSEPSLIYWLPGTLEVILSVQNWRKQGIEAYFTIDAGPNVHIICESGGHKKVLKKVMGIHGVKKVIMNKPSIGARIVKIKKR